MSVCSMRRLDDEPRGDWGARGKGAGERSLSISIRRCDGLQSPAARDLASIPLRLSVSNLIGIAGHEMPQLVAFVPTDLDVSIFFCAEVLQRAAATQ